MKELGSLAAVSLREAWAHEAHDFTPWLAGNLNHLSSAIGIQLEVDDTEVHVGPLRADIVARDPSDDTRVLIETSWSTRTFTISARSSHISRVLRPRSSSGLPRSSRNLTCRPSGG